MQTLTHDPSSDDRATSYIHDFRELFGVDEKIDDTIIAKQKEVFGFSLFLLHSKSIFEGLRIGFLNSRNVFERTKGILSIPHTYIFGGMALGFVLQVIHATFLFLPIFFTLVLLSLVPAFRIIREKMELYKKSRIFFDVDIETADMIKKEFLDLTPFQHKPMMLKSKGGGQMDGNSFGGKMFLFLFGQPFIFGHLHLFAGFPIPELIIFDIALFFILFGVFEKLIFLGFAVFYSIYFYIFDHLPFLFSRVEQERDFYMDLYESGTKLLTSLDDLERDMTDAKNGTINSSLGKNLSATIAQIHSLYDLIEKKSYLLEGKSKFQGFLIGMLNEVLTIYAYVFDFLAEKIRGIEEGIDVSDLDDVRKKYLLQIIKPIIEGKKEELKKMKENILSKRILSKP